MSNTNQSTSNSGVGFLGLLGIVFITLKLLGVITWSWWWVTAPLWGGFLMGVVIVGIVLISLFVLNKGE